MSRVAAVPGSPDELPTELRFERCSAWFCREGVVWASILLACAGAQLFGLWAFCVGLTLMLPGFVATLVHRRREVCRAIAHVEAMAPTMTTPQLSALVEQLEAHWDDDLNRDMWPLRELVERRVRRETHPRLSMNAPVPDEPRV